MNRKSTLQKSGVVSLSLQQLRSITQEVKAVQVPFEKLTPKIGCRVSVQLKLSEQPRISKFGLFYKQTGYVTQMKCREVERLRRMGHSVQIIGKVADYPLGGRMNLLSAPGRSIKTWSAGGRFHKISASTFRTARGRISFGGAGGGGFGRGGDGGGNDDDIPFSAIPGDKSGASRRPNSTSRRIKRLEELLFVVVGMKTDIESLIEGEKKKEKEGDGRPPHSGLFVSCVDEGKLSDCFYAMHQHFFPLAGETRFRGSYNKDIDFVAMLYVLVKDRKMGSEKCGMKPFYKFVRSRVYTSTELKGSDRTFMNRLNNQFLFFKEKVKKNSAIVKTKGAAPNQEELNFLALREFFLETTFYKEIKPFLSQIDI